jgi:hypothetical protein
MIPLQKNFLHISINSENPFTFTRITAILNNASNWIRYMPNNFIIRTRHDPNYWYNKIKPFLKENEYIFITKMDINERQGWLPKNVWDWIKVNQ